MKKNSEEIKKGIGFRIRRRIRSTDTAIIAIHGGGIEHGTSEIADEIAGNDHSFYTFEGTKKRGNFDEFHTTSTEFKEQDCLEIIKKSEKVVSIHGSNRKDRKRDSVLLGGLDQNLKDKIRNRLEHKGFLVEDAPHEIAAERQENICNQGKNASGVQIEIQNGLRGKMFEGNHKTKKGRANTTAVFDRFVSAIKEAIK